MVYNGTPYPPTPRCGKCGGGVWEGAKPRDWLAGEVQTEFNVRARMSCKLVSMRVLIVVCWLLVRALTSCKLVSMRVLSPLSYVGFLCTFCVQCGLFKDLCRTMWAFCRAVWIRRFCLDPAAVSPFRLSPIDGVSGRPYGAFRAFSLASQKLCGFLQDS